MHLFFYVFLSHDCSGFHGLIIYKSVIADIQHNFKTAAFHRMILFEENCFLSLVFGQSKSLAADVLNFGRFISIAAASLAAVNC